MNKFYLRVFTEHFAFGLIIPISVVWMLQQNLSLLEVGTVEAVMMLSTVMIEIPAGYFADKFSNKASLSMGSFLHFIGIATMFFATSVPYFIASAILSGSGWAFISGADEAHVHDDYEDSKKQFQKNISRMQIVDELGTIIGMALSSLIIAVSGSDLQLVIGVASISMLLVSMYSALFLPSKRLEQNDHLESELTIFKMFTKNIKKHWLIFLGLAVIYEYGRFLWQPKMLEVGVDVASLGLLYVAFKIASIIGSYIASRSQLNKKIIGTFFLMSLVSLLSFALNSKIILILGLVVLLICENFLRVWQSVVLNKLTSSRRASFLSSASLSRSLTGAAVVFTLGIPAQTSIGLAIMILVALKLAAGFMISFRLYSRASL